MSAGVVGREINAAFARCSTWGTPASVTRQVLLKSLSGFESQVGIVDDETFNQTFRQAGEVGDHMPNTPELEVQMRYEDVDTWIAAAMGSAANPTVVSSQAANSLVAYSHVVTMATELTHFFTIAADLQNFIQEMPSVKFRGYNIRVGENGRMMVAFQMVSAKTNYDSTVNTNSTVAGARAASLGNRLFRKDGVIRMNVASGGALGSSDNISNNVKEVSFGPSRTMSDDDFVFAQNYIIEADDSGYPDIPVEFQYARMTTQAANSLVIGLQAGRTFKADITFTGPYINTLTQRSALWQFPALQLKTITMTADGPGQVKPRAVFMARLAASAPTGMAVTLPMQLTLVNANSQNLLV